MALFGYKPKWKKALWVKPSKKKVVLFKPRSPLQKRLDAIEKKARKKASRSSLRSSATRSIRRELTLRYIREVRVWKNGRVCAQCGDKEIDCHHSRGKLGLLLVEQRFWIPLCRRCHRTTHGNVAAARLIQVQVDGVWLPLICAAGDWNKLPHESK